MGCSGFPLFVPLLHKSESPLRRPIRMTKVAAVRRPVFNGVRWRYKVEGMVPGFEGNRVLAGLGHVTFYAPAPEAGGDVVRVIGKRAVVRPVILSGSVARKTQRVRLR